MNAQLLSAGIAVGSIVVYQICIKAVPNELNPISVMVTFYATALVFTLISAKFVPVVAPSWSLHEISWAAVLVGIAIVGIELGYLLMYRSGWQLAVAPLIGLGGAVIILAPLGYLIFREPLSLKNIAGILLCLYGLYLLTPQNSGS